MPKKGEEKSTVLAPGSFRPGRAGWIFDEGYPKKTANHTEGLIIFYPIQNSLTRTRVHIGAAPSAAVIYFFNVYK